MVDLTIKLVESQEEVDKLAEIIKVALQKERKYFPLKPCGNETPELCISKYRHGKYEMLAAFLRENIIDWIGFAVGIEKGDEYFSDGLYVLPEFRSRGIGTQLKKAQIELARKRGCKSIKTYIERDNISSIRVQEKTGFTIYRWGGDYCCAALTIS